MIHAGDCPNLQVIRGAQRRRRSVLAPHPLLETHLDTLVDALQAVQRGAHVQREDGVALFVRRRRVVVDDVSDLRVARGGTGDDPVMPVEGGLSAATSALVPGSRWRQGTHLNLDGKSFPAQRCILALGESLPGFPWNLDNMADSPLLSTTNST